jgi:hypothetical protein
MAVLLLAAIPSMAQDMSAFLPKSATTGPALLPGEGLAMGNGFGPMKTYGDFRRMTPMGSLARLLWLRLEGDDWGTMDVEFDCKGEWNGFQCWNHKGHGRVDLAEALRDDCDLAFLAWAAMSTLKSKTEDGEDITRMHLEEVFKPFWSDRVDPRGPLPAFGPAWMGDGDLLRTSPEAFLRWMMDAGQERLLSRIRRLLIPVYKEKPGKPEWWITTGYARSRGVSGTDPAWVVGGDGTSFAVLYLPKGGGVVADIKRFRSLLGIP